MPAKRRHPPFQPPVIILSISLVVGCAGQPIAPEGSDGPTATAPPPPVTIDQRKTADEQVAELQRLVAETKVVPLLGRGDILNISVYDEPELSIAGVPVRPDGKISFPLVGDVQAEGRSVDQLTADLTAGLRKFLLTPQVTVIVSAFNSLNYILNGEVVHPGAYSLVTDVTLAAAIAKAGGLAKGMFRGSSVELADLTHAMIVRQGKLLPVDFVRLLRQGDMRFNVALQSGDYIAIPSGLSKEVYIIGEVNTPSLFGFRDDMPMSKTLALAEGFTKDADLARVHVIRGSLSNPTLIIVDFNKVIAGQEQDVQLEPGDLVYVPPTTLTSWTRMVDKITPTLTAIQTAMIFAKTMSSNK